MILTPPIRLELGAGNKPTPGFVHHGPWLHDPHIDIAFDLDVMPWPIDDGSVTHLLAIDVFEHLQDGSIQRWMDECWRVVAPGGTLEFRYPHHGNDYSFRDPTHRHLPRHLETWHYWCRDAPGSCFENFGRYMFGEGYDKWWSFRSSVIDKAHGSKDVRVTLCKP